MLLSVLLLLLVSRTRASHFYGTVMTYYPGETRADGTVSVILRYKLNYAFCSSDPWVCNGNCGNVTQSLSDTTVDQSSGDWCQREGIITLVLPNNSPPQLVLASGSWPSNLNGILSWRAVTGVELRKRSDINKPNTSPQTTVFPVFRLPSNCQRNIDLLAFDPDGDEVMCRYGSNVLFECNPCTPPSVLSISPSCTLSFSPTSSSNEGLYAVQLVMEDFPRQPITLTHTNGSQETKTTNTTISKIPIQFLLKVISSIPSCSDGLILPRFLPPTPDNRAQISTSVYQTVEIPVMAEATQSTITELLFSGPYNVVKSTSGSGNFTLKWTPSDSEDRQSHSICFVVQASYSYGKNTRSSHSCFWQRDSATYRPGYATFLYQSELRCVTVQIFTTRFVYVLNLKISAAMSLENNKDVIVKLIKGELINRGLPSQLSVRLLRNRLVKVATTLSG